MQTIKLGKRVIQDGRSVVLSAAELTKRYQGVMSTSANYLKTAGKYSLRAGFVVDAYGFMSNPTLQQGATAFTSSATSYMAYLAPATLPYALCVTIFGAENTNKAIVTSWNVSMDKYNTYGIPPSAWMH